MKTTAFLIFCAGVLITSYNRVMASPSDERGENGKVKGVKEEIPPPRPSFPLLSLPSFSSFSLPALNFPYLQAFSQPSRISSPERIRATKTEYVEVTRRQTVHPVCYTAYEAKVPCLSYAQSDFHEDDYDNSDLEAVYQTNDGFNLNEIKKATRSTSPTTKESDFGEEETQNDNNRSGKYLELKLRRNSAVESSSRIEGSEFFPILNRVPAQPQATEYHTKTVLITKLEKYTDRRVTATLLAVNCLPVDRAIPMCQNYPNPIKEAPDHRSDDINLEESSFNPTLTNSENFEFANSSNTNLKSETGYTDTKTKPQVGTSIVEPAEMDSEETLLGEE